MRPLVLAVAAAAALIVAALIPSASATRGKIPVIEILYAHRSDGLIDAYRTQVRDRRDRVIGYGAWACIRVGESVSLSQCDGTLSLPGGQLMTQGAIVYRTAFSFAVVGGTGRYTGSTGAGHSDMVRAGRWATTIWLQ